jgi:uncharacterized membrane protein
MNSPAQRRRAAPKGAALTRALGWVSLGLGAAQLAAPRALSRLTGLDGSERARALMPVMGAREISHGAGLIRGQQPSRWIWTRVAGDAMDLALLGQAIRSRGGERQRRLTVTTAAVAGITLLDLYAAMQTTKGRRTTRTDSRLQFEASVTIRTTPTEAYRYWRNLENLPSFMVHLDSVQALSEGRSRWTAAAPAGTTVTWEAEITGDKPGELIGWRSLPGATVPNSGSVRFRPAPGNRGTEVRVELAYNPPGGKIGAAVARLFGENPEQQVRDDLRRFKQLMETGEVVLSEGSPEGTRATRQLLQRPAKPTPEPTEYAESASGRRTR